MHSKLENLQRQLQDLKDLRYQSEPEADFELVDCSQEPLFQVVDFLGSRKLGPAGMELYEAISCRNALKESQIALLEKICSKLGHKDWPIQILQEISTYQEALSHVK
jgi:hypothetical protein